MELLYLLLTGAAVLCLLDGQDEVAATLAQVAVKIAEHQQVHGDYILVE